jgi:hypothetical protein
MASNSEKQARLELLRKMRDSGVSSTSVDGVQTTFRSMADLQEAIKILEQELGIRKKRSRFKSVFMGHR